MRVGPGAFALLLLTLSGGFASGVEGQTPARAVLRGRVMVGDTAMRSGVVLLHHVSSEAQGSVDSVRVGRDGSFTVTLPGVPDPQHSETYFASVRHQGILYFGPAITTAAQLDSIYTIQTYDTAMVATPEGRDFPVEIRNVFLEPQEEGEGWRVTDLLQVRNSGDRTLVAGEDGIIWRYTMPPRATNFETGQSDFMPGTTRFEDHEMLVTSALPPGERLFVVRYDVPDPYMALPLPGTTETVDIFVREPAPPLQIAGLEPAEPLALESGATFRHFTGSGFADTVLRIREGEAPSRIPVAWMAVLLSLALAAVALWAFQRRPQPSPVPVPESAVPEREALILEIARLDREFEALLDPTPEERERYAERRRALLRLLTSES